MIKLMHYLYFRVDHWSWSSDLHADFHSDSALYPDSGIQYDSGLSQGGTDSGLHSDSWHPEWSSSQQLSTYPDSCF